MDEFRIGEKSGRWDSCPDTDEAAAAVSSITFPQEDGMFWAAGACGRAGGAACLDVQCLRFAVRLGSDPAFRPGARRLFCHLPELFRSIFVCTGHRKPRSQFAARLAVPEMAQGDGAVSGGLQIHAWSRG